MNYPRCLCRPLAAAQPSRANEPPAPTMTSPLPDHRRSDPPEAEELSSTQPESVEWRVHLARRQPARAAAASMAVLGAGAWAFYLFQHVVPALVTVGLLVAATGEFMFPISYRLSPAGAEARNPFGWRRIGWGEVMRVYVGNDEIKLSPLKHGGPREAFRGVLLRCEGNREVVLAAVQRFRDAADRS